MSMTGSLMGYENNNEVNQAKCKKPLKPLPVVSSISSTGVTITSKTRKPRKSAKRGSCVHGHMNSLWSVWYGILAFAFQAYIGLRYTKRFSAYLSLPWPADAPPPRSELYACLILACTGVILLPFFVGAALTKLGNLANDGIKLGRHLSTCSRDPTSSLLTNSPDNRTTKRLVKNLCRHGGPTAAFMHLCSAMCLLLPSLIMEARLIHAGFLPKEAVWRTDLDWVVSHRDRLVVLSFMNPYVNLSTLTGLITPQPFVTLEPEDEIEELNGITTSSGITNIMDEIDETTTKLSTLFRPISTGLPHARISSSTETTSSTSTTTSTTSSTQETITTTTRTITPSTYRSTTARRPTTKTVVRNNNSKSRSKTKNVGKASTTIRPTRMASGGNMTGQSMSLAMNSLADLDHPEKLNLELESAESYGPITLEYLNYAAALGVYSVRYPAVFWSCNKALGTIFSLQLVINSIQSLVSYTGMSILYKIQVIGPLKILPHLRHRTISTTSTISNIFKTYFLLNPHVTLVLFALSSLLVLCSSMVVYFYAYDRFAVFLNHERERRVILPKGSRGGNGWAYFTQYTSLCVFFAIMICTAPFLYEYIRLYRGSLDGLIFACIVVTILHQFSWIFLWMFFLIKQRWTFKLRSSRPMKRMADVDLLSRDEEDGTSAPLVVVANGRTYTIADTSPKKAIMSVIQKAIERKTRTQGGNVGSVDGESTADEDEQIYWLRPKLRPSPAQSPNDANGSATTEKGWLNKKLKPKVTFNDLPSTSGSRNKGKARRGTADGGPDDDGDYATLRELPLITSLDPADDSTSEENKWGRWLISRRDGIPKFGDLLECVNDDQVTYYASANRDLQPSEGDPSPLLTPDPLPDPGSEPLPLPPPTPTSAPTTEVITAPLTTNTQTNSGQTPRCLRRADSGMPHDELTPRSDSSNSPPLDAVGGAGSVAGHSNTSSNSETSSSGVHSNASNVSHTSSQRRATSVDDLTGEPREEPREQWRSCSLQRGTQPPTANTTFSPPNSRPGTSQSFSSPQYANHVPLFTNANGTEVTGGCPAVILENPNEATVVIRRKLSRTKLTDPLNPNEEPFGRSTNMRMTSFTESNDIRVHSSSATLPHYPTQPAVTYPHCSTMPLPHASHSMAGSNMSGSTGSCGSVPRHTFVPPQVHTTVPAHTTLPSHHNGVRLIHGGPNNPFVKRFPPVQLHTQPWALPGHHTFPQVTQTNNKLSVTAQIRQSDRDSANFSMASSGDSDTCLPH